MTRALAAFLVGEFLVAMALFALHILKGLT